MPRRRLESPSADRLAAILGISSAATPATASPQLAGWVPQRISVDPIPASAIPASAIPAPVLTAAMLEDNGRHRRPAPPKPAILTVPVALRGVRARPRRLAVLGVLVVLVTAALVLGIRVAWARSSARPQPVAATAHGPPGGLVSRTVPAAFGSAGAAGLPTAAGVLLVHVVGQVRRPGVVRLPPGARVLDAVQAAGGATSSADLNHLNLARLVADGEQIVVPKPGESILTGGVSGAGGAGAGSSGVGSVGGLIDLNTADVSALDSLPGVGPVLAQRILEWRAQHGRFTSVDELGEVSGIGDKILAQIRPKVTV
ncbi:MAG: helix-hairpin-helix domain-containing protein [Dermatophilaceae bacterium]